MLMSDVLKRDNIFKVAMEPLIKILFLPSLEMHLLISKSPSKVIPNSDRIFVNRWFLGKVKRASTSASAHPLRIRSVDARVPKTKFMALIIMDFPAPVSPERMLRDELRLICNCLMIAKLEMFSWTSIWFSRVTPR